MKKRPFTLTTFAALSADDKSCNHNDDDTDEGFAPCSVSFRTGTGTTAHQHHLQHALKKHKPLSMQTHETKTNTSHFNFFSLPSTVPPSSATTVNAAPLVSVTEGPFAQLEEHLQRDAPSWYQMLSDEFSKPYWTHLKNKLNAEDKRLASNSQCLQIFPPLHHVFAAFQHCAFDKTKVVIIGQDPYVSKGQAEGMCFSVPKTVKQIPPSLVNIYQEIANDCKTTSPKLTHGHLKRWAEQGVLLLNSTLTVTEGCMNSHVDYGWDHFTTAVIEQLNRHKSNLVFLLWGAFAKKKAKCLFAQTRQHQQTKHLVLQAAHPSPKSAADGFFGCRHFSAANEYLKQHDMAPIDWEISS